MADKDSRDHHHHHQGQEQQGAGGGSRRNESPSPFQLPAITGEEKEVATAAHSHFEAGNYNGCVEQVRRLSSMRPLDPRVQHNLAVALFYQSGCRKVDEYRRSLGQVCSQVHIDLEQIDSLEDADQAIFFFNNAVLLHHLRQHHQAINVLEKLFQVIEPLEEWLGLRILLLLIESYLISQQPDKALATLVYLEKMMQTSEAKREAADKGKEAKDEEQRPVDTEKVKAKVHQFKTKCYLQLKHLKFCKREIKSVKSVTNSNGAQSPITLFLKANFEFERQNNRKAIKLLNSAPEGQDYRQTGQCVPVMYYNNLVCVHYAMHKYHLAAHYARRALQDNAAAVKELPKKSSGRAIQTLGMNRHHELLYNTGIVLLHAGRPLAAFDCLVEAVQVFPTNPRLWLRLAECCIAANRKTGVDGDGKGVPGSGKQSIIHSTVGTGSHRKFILSPVSADANYGSDIQPAAMPVASLEFASLCLNSALALLPEKLAQSLPTTPVSTQNSVSSEASDSTSKQPGPTFIPAPPGPPLKPPEVSSLRCSVLAASAYICLALGDDVTALEHARTLMATPKLSGSLQFLARMYAAEALLKHDQIGEAIQLLNPETVCDVSVLITPTPDHGENKDRDRNEKSNNHDGGGAGGTNNNTGDPGDGGEPRKVIHQYYPASIQVARAHMFFNLATTHALRNEWEKARKCLTQGCTMIPAHDIPKQALYTAIYLELHTGNYSMALQMVKKQQLIPYVKPPSSSFPDPLSRPYHALATPSNPSITPGIFPAPIGSPASTSSSSSAAPSRPSAFTLPTPIGGGKPSASTWR